MSSGGLVNDPTEIGLGHYLDIVRRRKWTVLAVLAVAVAAGASYGLTASKKYEARMQIVVGQGQGLVSPAYLGASVQPITATMAQLAKSTIVAQRVIARLQLHTTTESLLKHVSVAINPQTAVLQVSVTSSTKAQAVEVAQALGIVFSRLVAQRFSATPQPNGANNATAPMTATVFDPAHALPNAVSPRPKLDIAIGAILGLVLGILAAFGKNYFDRRLRDRDSVERAFGVPVIGQIPFRHGRSRRAGRVEWSDFGEMVEAFRGLRANLSYLSVRSPLRTILITSATPGQGKTTVAANLGLAISRLGSSTAVVEADLRRPRLNDAFGLEDDDAGLSGLLAGIVELDDALRDVPDRSGQARGRLALLPSGALPPNPAELLSSFQMRDVLDRLRQGFEHVIVDSSPLLLVADPLELARMVDGVIVVVRKDSASRDEARELRAIVERLGVNLLGVVLTDTEHIGASYGHYGERPSEPGRRRPGLRPARRAVVGQKEA
jgi:capsular exopolysaccharide synthesis family protein